MEDLKTAPVFMAVNAFILAFYGIDVFSYIALTAGVLLAVFMSDKTTFKNALIQFVFALIACPYAVAYLHTAQPEVAKQGSAFFISFLMTYLWRTIMKVLDKSGETIVTHTPATIRIFFKTVQSWIIKGGR